MAEGDKDPEQQTEEPTQKRLEEAVKKGNIPVSREVAHFFAMALLAAIIIAAIPGMMKDTGKLLIPILSHVGELPADRQGLGVILQRLIFGGLGIVALPFAGAMVLGIAASVLQNGFILTSEPLMPQLSRLSPMAGIGRIFSKKSLVELIKNLLKVGVVAYVSFVAVYPELGGVRQLPNKNLDAILMFLLMLATRLAIGVAVAMFLIALTDLLYQRFAYIKSLRMTRQEVKDEYKQSEGDPHIKQRLRQIRQERAKNRMMLNVPDADVVVTNPTHYSVALKYDNAAMRAPTVVAKGADLVALKIREIAQENDVPIVENAPLARVLFASVKIDEEIPTEHYAAVAKIISYVYQLKGRRA